jgi:hypothetical protein
MNREEFERELGRPLIGREGFVSAVTRAMEEGRPYAAGKIGNTEQVVLHTPLVVASEEEGSLRRRAFELGVSRRAYDMSGVFPEDPSFLLRFAERLASDARELDCIGLYRDRWRIELDLMRGHDIGADPVEYVDQELDLGIPADDARSYLPAFRGKRVLIACSFAEFLKGRANRETFEATWAKAGKRWFEPASVEALSFPYVYEEETRAHYGTSFDLIDEISERMAEREFDVVLIAAAALGIPIAVAAKRLGAVGISLGSGLQIAFGVYGGRWLAEPDWRRDYFNDAWTRLPEEDRPRGHEDLHYDVNYW